MRNRNIRCYLHDCGFKFLDFFLYLLTLTPIPICMFPISEDGNPSHQDAWYSQTISSFSNHLSDGVIYKRVPRFKTNFQKFIHFRNLDALTTPDSNGFQIFGTHDCARATMTCSIGMPTDDATEANQILPGGSNAHNLYIRSLTSSLMACCVSQVSNPRM